MYKFTCQCFKYNIIISLYEKWKTNLDCKEQVCNINTCQTTRNKIFKSPVFNLQEATEDQVQEFLKSFDTVITDCDGVLWMQDQAIPGSADTLNHLRMLGKRIIYLTNNSTKLRNEFARKAQDLGFIASQEEIITGAYLAAHYLKCIGFTKKVYLLGANGIGKELEAVGIRHIGVGPDHVKPDFKSMKMSDLDPEVGAVVLSYDKHISYPKLMKAASYLTFEDCLFVAIDTDEKYSRAGCIVLPGVGIFVKALETLTKKKAVIVGKPHDYVQKYLKECGINSARTLMIGDTCTTDIELGVRCGFHTLLVLSGVTTAEEVEKLRREKTPPLPDVVLPKLGDLLTLVQS